MVSFRNSRKFSLRFPRFPRYHRVPFPIDKNFKFFRVHRIFNAFFTSFPGFPIKNNLAEFSEKLLIKIWIPLAVTEIFFFPFPRPFIAPYRHIENSLSRFEIKFNERVTRSYIWKKSKKKIYISIPPLSQYFLHLQVKTTQRYPNLICK